MKYIKLFAVLLSVSLAACTGSGASYTALGSSAYSSASGNANNPFIRTAENTSQIPSLDDAVVSNSNPQPSNSLISSGATGPNGTPGTNSGTGTPDGQTPVDTSSRPVQQTTSSNTTSKPTSPASSAAQTNPTTSTPPTSPTSPTTSTKPNDPPAPPPPASSAVPKTAYDKPYDINQIRADMIAYGQSKGLVLESSFYVQNAPPNYPSNAGYQFPMDTSVDVGSAAQFKQYCRDDIDGLIAWAQATEPNVKASDIRFNVALLPLQNDPSNYFVFVLYG